MRKNPIFPTPNNNYNCIKMSKAAVKSLDPNSGIGQIWMEVLVQDQATKAASMLENADSAVRDQLLHGNILEDPIQEALFADRRKIRLPGFRIIRPLNTAIAFGSFGVVQVFLDYNVDVFLKDFIGNTIFHSLVYLAYLDPGQESAFVSIHKQLVKHFDVDTLKELLFTENTLGLRPLEVAIHLGAFEMYQTIFDTPGVYLIRQQIFRTLYYVNWYDVTDYEHFADGNRRNKSPLLFLIFIDQERLNAATEAGLYIADPMQDWIRKKCDAYGPFLWIWIFLRFLFAVLFFVYDFSTPSLQVFANSTQHNSSPECYISETIVLPHGVRLSIMLYLLAYSALGIILDTGEVLHVIKTIATFIRKTPRRLKKYVAFYRLYRALQFMLYVNTLAFMTLTAVEYNGHITATFPKHLIYLFQSSLMVWSLLYFFQLTSFLGYLVVVVQRLIKDLLRFILIFFLIMIPFAFTFRIIFKDEPTCVEPFSTIPVSIYTTFTVILNMVNFSDLSLSQTFPSIAIVHIVFVFVVAILLVNFLIALFSSSINAITENRDVIMTIQRLSVYWTLDYRLGKLLHRVGGANSMLDRRFIVRNNRVYITKVMVRGGKPQLMNQPDEDARTITLDH